jgi:hypothetical protein
MVGFALASIGITSNLEIALIGGRATKDLNLLVDRDINAGINIKRVGLDMFPTIKRCKGNIEIVVSITDITSKEVVQILRGL